MNFKKWISMAMALVAFLAVSAPAFTAKALTYSEISQGKVLGDSTSFYPYPTGTLVNDSGTIYFISGTTKVPFTSWQAFVGLGYGGKTVVEGDLTNYAPSQNYVISTANAAHPWGSWLIYKGTVYYSTQAGLIGVPSASVFTSNGGDWTYIVRANSYDIAVLNANPNLPLLAVSDSRITTTPTYQFGNTPNGSSAGTNPSNTGQNQNSTTLQVNTNFVNFNAVAGGSAPALQPFIVYPGSSTASWTAQVQSSAIPGLNLSYNGTVGATVNGTGTATVNASVVGPFTAGNYNSSILVTSGGQTYTVNAYLTVSSTSSSSNLQIVSPRVAIGTVGQWYSMDVPYSYSGASTVMATWTGLPGGITGQSTSANKDLILSGTPTQAGTYTITLQLTDQVSTASQTFTIVVNSATSASTVTVSPSTLNFAATVGGSAPAMQYVAINPGSSTASWTAKYTGQNNINVNANLGYNGAVGGIVSGTGPGNMSVYVPGPFTTAGTYNDYFIVISGGQTQTVYITLTVTKPSPVLSVNLSSAMASPTSLTSGTSGQRVASFQISANSASAASINSITIGATRNTIGNNFQNLVAMVSRSQVGTTQSVFTANGQYTFNFSSPLPIPAGGSAIVDVYLDVSSSVNSSNFNVSNQNLVSLNSLTGTWTIDNSVIPAITPIAGQAVTLSTSSSLQISPSSLSFSASVSGNPPNLQYFYITPVSSANNSWTAQITSSSIPNLYLMYGTQTSEMGQVLNGSGSATIQVGATGPFTAGNYNGTITITSGGQTQIISVSLMAQ